MQPKRNSLHPIKSSNYTARCFVSFRYGMICNVHTMTCLIGAHLSKPGTLRRELWERAYTLWILMAPTHVFARPIIWARRSNTPCRRSWPAAANSSGITYLSIDLSRLLPYSVSPHSVSTTSITTVRYKSTWPCPIFPARDGQYINGLCLFPHQFREATPLGPVWSHRWTLGWKKRTEDGDVITGCNEWFIRQMCVWTVISENDLCVNSRLTLQLKSVSNIDRRWFQFNLLIYLVV